MAIIKSKHSGDYTVIPNTICRSKMSLEAIGLLTILLSNRHDWIIYKTTLHNELGIGREKLNRIFKELQDNGYIISVKNIDPITGHFEYTHVVYDKPFNGEEAKPDTEIPSTEIPSTGLPSTVDQPLISINTTSTNKTSTKETSTKKIIDEFEIFWDKYPYKVSKKKCLDLYGKLKDNERARLHERLTRFIQYKPFETYRHPNPDTFLRNKRWEDELPFDKELQRKAEIAERDSDPLQQY